MEAAGSSHAETVKAPASQVNAAGSSRRWISAGRVNAVLRWAHSNRSVCRRLAITTNASMCPIRAIWVSTAGSGSSGRDSRSSPSASPRSVTGAKTTQSWRPLLVALRDEGATTRTFWVRSASSAAAEEEGGLGAQRASDGLQWRGVLRGVQDPA